MKIYDAIDNLILDIDVDDTSYRYRVIMGDHNLTLRYSLPEHVELPVGAYCKFQETRYTLMRPEDFKKVNSRNYDYTVVFQGVEYLARIWKFRNPVDGRLKFPLTATPREHLQMFVDNMNRRDTGWSVGDCIDGTEVLINYDHDYCKDALAKMASELKTEYHFDGKRVSLCKLEVNKSTPLPLSYGRGNGFKTGVGRANSGDTLPTEILFVQGGTENIDRSKYPPLDEPRVRASSGGCLLLPRNASLQFDGDFFEDEDGFNPDIARTYASDDLGLSIRRVGGDSSMMAEDSLDCSAIYPKRVGEVSEVVRIKREGGDLFDIIDKDIPDLLNYEKYTIGDETMTIRFQTGMLAGKEFDVKYYHNATNINGVEKKGHRFEIVPQEIDGIMMPGDCFIPDVYDKYAIFHCSLPDDYINAYRGSNPVKSGAEWDMFREAVKHLYEAEQQHFTFSGTLDGLWAKKNWANIGGRIVLGGFILFSDNDFAPEGVRVRITGIKDYVNNPHSPEIELSNSIIGASVSTTLKELTAEEVNVETKHTEAIQYSRRRWRDAQETMTMLEKAMLNNFSESISPVAVRTMQMLVGDEALQFEFVGSIPSDDTTQHPPVVNHVVKWKSDTRQLECPGGIIKHLTIDIPKDLTATHKPQEYHYWPIDGFISDKLTDGAQKYYLYAKVPQAGGKGEFSLETDAKSLLSDGYYWLLMGVLGSEYGGKRNYVSLHGFSEILPGRITTERVVSSNGDSYFDMQNEAMKLGDRLEFNTKGDNNLILRGTLVQSESGQIEHIGCFRGEWNASYTYYRGDEVTYFDEKTKTTSTYRYYNDTPMAGVAPINTTYWQVIAQGSQGIPGVSPNTSFKAVAFYRINGTPPDPVGGSYASPTPTNGWSDGVPAGDEKLWMTTRIFSSDGKIPQQVSWTTPRQMTDTADFDVEFSSEENPSKPTGHPNTNPEWSNEATEDTIWMATSRMSNGEWSDWQVMRVKGENGSDGTSLTIKGTAEFHFRTRADYDAAITIAGEYYLIDYDEVLNANCVYAYSPFGKEPEFTVATNGDAFVYSKDGHLYVANGDSGWSDIGQFKGEQGNNGENAYLHIKYATSEVRGSWSANNGETPDKYIGLYSDNNIADPACTDANWDLFTWSKWEGRDGFGYEYIYKRTDTATAPATPTATSQADEYVPDGWTDDPSGVTSTYQWEWQCYRKKTDGVWGAFIGSASNNAVAALWAKYGETGATGDYTEIRYAAGNSYTNPPTFNATNLNLQLWLTSLSEVQSSGQYIWQTSARFSAAGVRKTSWTTPVRLTGLRGAQGESGKSPALVFRGDYNSDAEYIGNEYRVDAVRATVNGDSTFFVAQIGAGTFKGIAPPDANKWHPFGATFDSVATNLLLAENANIGDWFMSGGKIVSTLSSEDVIELDAKNNRIYIKSATSGGDFAAETGLGSKIELNAATGIIEARSNDPDLALSYMSPSGIFANRAGTRCVASSLGYDQRAAIVGVGNGNLSKDYDDDNRLGSETNIIAGVYGTSSNDGTATHYGGYFTNLKACGLVLNTKYVGKSPEYEILSDTDSLVIGYDDNNPTDVYLPAATREGQTIFVKHYGRGFLRFYTQGGQHIYDDSTENAPYYDFANGWGGVFHFTRTFINNTLTHIWLVSRYKF